jgi:hypothetical protein
MKNISRVFQSALAVLVISVGYGTVHAATSDEAFDIAGKLSHGWGFPDPIEGVWNVKVYLMPCGSPQPPNPAFEAMAMFVRGGAFHDANSSNPVAPANQTLRSEAFGHWEHVKGRTYQFAFRFFRFDLAGTFIGTQIVRHTVTLARDGESYVSEGAPEFYDVAGERTPPPGPPGAPPPCSTSTATRFE